MDDRIILHDIDGNGLPEAFIPDSGNGAGNSKFVWILFLLQNRNVAIL